MRRSLIAVVTVLAYSALYAPQPLLPLLAERFAVAQSTAALLITVALLPLGIAPLSYGYLLQRVAPARVLRLSVLALAASQLAFGAADGFATLLGIRLLQGLLLPAVFTSAMTYIATAAAPERVAREMSVYVAASIGGGYLGRLLSGVSAAVVGWRTIFFVLGGALLLAGVLLGRERGAGPRQAPARPSLRLVAGVLRTRGVLPLYLLAFCFFFVFAGLLNFLPFRLAELTGRPASSSTGLIYTGYLLGVATSLGSARIAAWVGGERRALVLAFGALAAALLLCLVPRIAVLFGALFAFCGAVFLMHALATGLVNRGAGDRAGIVNGLYLVFYYTGGVLGSYLPGLAYERLGWGAFLMILLGVAGAGWALALAWRPAAGHHPATRAGGHA